jgi:hypothetical protein
MKKLWIVLAGLGILAACGALLAYFVAAPAKDAARNLAAINSLSAGKTTEVELLSRKEFQKVDRKCFEARCVYHMEAENALLSRLHLAPRTFILTTVTVRDGLVVEVGAITFRGEGPAMSIIQLPNLPEDCTASPCVKPLILPNHVVLGIRIMVDSASDVRNRLPQAINSQCLSRLRGCASNAEIMPLMKELNLQESPAGAVTVHQ